MNLDDWLKSGWLHVHQTSAREIADLFAIANRDLQTAQIEGLATDWKLAIAYNAALRLATAALAAAGYRASREAHHYRVIQSLAFTIGADKNMIDLLDTFRRIRNVSDYERAGTVSDRDADEMYHLAEQLRTHVLQWLRIHHEHLAKDIV
ncbi:MAG: hypothetical protein V1784_11115 [bacterium]